MYGNCSICGQRFGSDGVEWFEPCKHIKAQDKRIREKRTSEEIPDQGKPEHTGGSQSDVKRQG